MRITELTTPALLVEAHRLEGNVRTMAEALPGNRLRPHVKAGAEGFSITYVRAPKGKGAALHRHATEEVFLPIHGRWQVFWLEAEEERTIDLDEGDMCNVPIGIFRGFRNVSDDPDALLIAIVGGPEAGKVDWHPSVVTEARKTGLSVDDDGNLIVEKPAA